MAPKRIDRLSPPALPSKRQSSADFSAPTKVKRRHRSGPAPTPPRIEDRSADHQLAEGLSKHKQSLTAAEASAARKQLAFRPRPGDEIAKREFTPEARAAKGVRLASEAGIQALREGRPQDLLEAANSAEQDITALINETAAQLDNNPEAKERVRNTIAKLGDDGFREALESVGPELARAFTKVTGLRDPDDDGLIDDVGDFLETVRESPEIAWKIGRAGFKMIPGAGNAACAVTAGMNGINLLYSLATQPQETELIARAGVATLMQTLGTVAPSLGIMGDVWDARWTTEMALEDHREALQALPPAEVHSLVARLVREVAKVVEESDGATEAGTFSELADAVESAQSPEELEGMLLAFSLAFAGVAASNIESAAEGQQHPESQEALKAVAHGFSELYAVLYQQRRGSGHSAKKREDLSARLLRTVIDGAFGIASFGPGHKPAKGQEPGEE